MQQYLLFREIGDVYLWKIGGVYLWKIGLVGLGKMGISHYSIFNAHPEIDLAAVCDSSGFVLGFVEKHVEVQCFSDYRKIIDECNLDCVIIATPTFLHADIIRYALERGIHVFAEKPLCLKLEDSHEMVKLARERKLVNQVGYHNRFIAAFQEARRLIAAGAIGNVYHFTGETYGPVVLKSKGSTWRAKGSKGGGCLYDYASHVIDLVNYFFGKPDRVSGTVLKKIYSKNVEDAVYSTLLYNNGITGQLSVNWSDETYRKMTTCITAMGEAGKIVVDRQECRIYLKGKDGFEELKPGWNIHYTTELTECVDFYLRGEEYSSQLDYFVECITEGKTENINSFESALHTDTVINLLRKDAQERN